MKMSPKKGFTLIEMMVSVAIIGILMGFLLPLLTTAREQARKVQCRNNLQQLGLGMHMYIDTYGKGIYYPWPGTKAPTFKGGHWIASLYWTKLISDPALFLCPSTPDHNEGGGTLGMEYVKKNILPHEVSYMGRTGAGGGAIIDRMQPGTVMISDDTESTINHEYGYNILYFDGHVEWGSEIDPGLEAQTLVGKFKNIKPPGYVSSVLKN